MRITILGLGRMGTPMARCLIELGHEVTLYNRTREKAVNLAATGARVAYTVAEAVKTAQVALTMVSGDEAEEALTSGPGGLLESLTAGAIHLCMSTIGVEASRRLAAAHAKAGQGFVAAPVLGRPNLAASRQLWILAAGPDAQVNRCLAVLEALGRGVTRVGTEPELAHALKLGANALTVAMVAALSEVLAFGEKAGFSPADYMRIINTGLFKSPLLDAFGGLMVRRDHEPSDQTLDLAAKDMDLLLKAASAMTVGMPVAGAMLGQIEAARSRHLGDRDLTALAMVRRAEAGLDELPAPKPAHPQERRKGSLPRKKGEHDRRKSAPKLEVPKPEVPKLEVPKLEVPEPAVQWEPVPEPVVVWLPAPEAPEAPAPPAGEAPIEGSRFSALDAQGTVWLDAEATTHFEEGEGAVWAWTGGKRHATFWKTFAEVELALGQIPFVKLQPRILLNPHAVQDIKPLFGGRAKVLVTGGLELSAGREAARRLTLLLGM